jgi:hypothetical protein
MHSHFDTHEFIVSTNESDMFHIKYAVMVRLVSTFQSFISMLPADGESRKRKRPTIR